MEDIPCSSKDGDQATQRVNTADENSLDSYFDAGIIQKFRLFKL